MRIHPSGCTKLSGENKSLLDFSSRLFVTRQRPTVPLPHGSSIIGLEGLTSVFGMGTVWPLRQGHRELLKNQTVNRYARRPIELSLISEQRN